MDGFFDELSVKDIHADLARNIVSIRETQDLFDDLTESPEARQAAINLEIHTKPHTYVSTQPIIDRAFEESAYNEAIDYPFKHWSTSRYSDGSYGVWYGAGSLETSIHETAYHWRNHFLSDVGWDQLEGVMIERKVYLIRCDAVLLDFIPKVGAFPALVDPVSYQFTHQIGARIQHDGHPGLVSQSARCAGSVYAVFNPRVLSAPRNHCFLTYRIAGDAVRVDRGGDFMFAISAA